MRHRKKKVTLGRETGPRGALLRNLAEQLIRHGSIKTTVGKAKALRTFVEPLVTQAKKQSLAKRREIRERLYTDEAINKLFNDLAPRYASRAGGYTRIVKLGSRASDSAEVARIEFV